MAVEDARARRYHCLRLVLAGLDLAVTVAYLLLVLALGLAGPIAAGAAAVWPGRAWQVAVMAAALGAGHRALTLPLDWIRGFLLPRRYGLLHQPLGGWARDRVKAGLIGGAFGLIAVEIVYALLGAIDAWWLVAAAAFLVLQTLVAFVFPVWLMPLFYRLTPLGDEALRARLVRLAARAGVSVVGVWVADQSRKSRTANAMLAGLGRTRRIVLFDTLVSGFAADEVESVLAHELGHHVHGDVWRGLGAYAALSVATLWVADRLLVRGPAWWGLDDPADPAGLPWLALVVLGLGLITLPVANGFSRRLERQADDFALALTSNPAGFVAAMERLAALNLAERRPHPVKEFLLYSHPSIDRRIARASPS